MHIFTLVDNRRIKIKGQGEGNGGFITRVHASYDDD